MPGAEGESGQGQAGGREREPSPPPTRPRRVRRSLREEEPFATIRAHPRRFGWGIPLVFAVSIGAGLPFAERSLSLAIAIQLFLQTAGLLWLYVPAARRGRSRPRAGEDAGGT